MRGLRNERGVAMQTVIFVAAALTAITSTAFVVTVQDFRAGTDDRKSAESLAYAEAGIDRMMQYVRSGFNINYGILRRAGCEDPALAMPVGRIGNGTFSVNMQVYDPTAASVANRYPQPPSGGACSATARPTNPRRGLYMLITSTGEHPASKRVVQQIVRVKVRGLPVGFIGDQVDGNGTPNMTGISILSSGRIIGRDKLDLTGLDPYYTLEDFWPGATWPAGLSGSSPVPAAAHAVGGNLLGPSSSNGEFPPNPNCTANKTNSNKQSLWDSDGSTGSGTVASTCTNQPTGYAGAYPPSSKFTQSDFNSVSGEQLTAEDYATLKRAAQVAGLYCYKPTSGAWSCVRQGGSPTGFTTDVSPIISSGTYNFVAYFEFQSGDPLDNNITWDSNVWPCSDDPALNRSVTIVVRNGGFNLSGNEMINGAVIADGAFDYTGNPTIKGTVIAQDFRIRGNATFALDSCWVNNIPGAFLGVTPTQWSEVDR